MDNKPKVYNRRRRGVPTTAVYVGRGGESRWGNPYKIGLERAAYTRTESIKLYREYAERRLQKDPHWLDELKGKDLVCYCAPLPCHADILLELANSEPNPKAD